MPEAIFNVYRETIKEVTLLPTSAVLVVSREYDKFEYMPYAVSLTSGTKFVFIRQKIVKAGGSVYLDGTTYPFYASLNDAGTILQVYTTNTSGQSRFSNGNGSPIIAFY